MPRFFVAIPLADEAKDRLIAIQPPALSGMRILGREELHLTLHFLGEVAAEDFEKVRTALTTVRMNAFTVAFKGVGVFERDGRPQVLWAGVETSAELLELHGAVGVALAAATGFRPEDRPYSPHITLARLNAPVPPEFIDRYLEQNKGFGIASVLLDRFVLYSSNFADNVGTAMHPEVFWIDRIGEGLLGIMPRPRGDDWLSDEIEALAKAGINVLVSLLTDDESAELALQDEEPHCGECGIRFISFNVRRRGEPPDWRQSEPDLGPDSGTLVNPRA